MNAVKDLSLEEIRNRLRSVAEEYEKVKFKFRPNANFYHVLKYFEALNAAIGGGGDLYAVDVKTSDESNVQVHLDDLETDVSGLETDVSDLTTVVNAIDLQIDVINGQIITINNDLDTINSELIVLGDAVSKLQPGLLSLSDNTPNTIISQTQNVTYMKFLVKNAGLNDTSLFSYSGETLSVLRTGYYFMSFRVHADKDGGGGSEGLLSVELEINGTPTNFSKIAVNNDGFVGTTFSGWVSLTLADTLKINLIDSGSGTLTAISDANSNAFSLQIHKLAE